MGPGRERMFHVKQCDGWQPIGAVALRVVEDVMQQQLALDLPAQGELTRTAWRLPAVMSLADWSAAGRALGRVEHAVSWWIGDWWAYGEHRYGERKAIVEAEDWTGPSFQTCRNCAAVVRSFETSRRRDVLSFTHHAEVAALPPEHADELLDAAVGQNWTTQQLRTAIKSRRRALREIALGDKIRGFGERRYGVIYADPPWRFEPYSRDTGMDRAADNHYPTLPLAAIEALAVPAADDCALFLWATAPMFPQALNVIAAWGFVYKTHCVWIKDKIGTGYWFRNLHELLLVATRGDMPAPPPSWRLPSVFNEPVGRHSEKPAAFAEFIEAWFPHVPKLEMFARQPRPGWDCWGNEVLEAAE